MKKNGVLNSHISEVLARLGHTDCIVIADCGLPIPDHVHRIDVSMKLGTPSFIDTLEVILADMEVETITLASEIKEMNSNVLKQIEEMTKGKNVQFISHQTFKEQTRQAKAIIRTGEATPYANIILHAGVIF